MSKYQFHQSDIYQPGTELPKNRLNIVDAELLHAVESHLLDWAGGYRTEDMVKGGSMFCRAAYLPAESRRIFGQLAQAKFLADAATTSREVFAERLAFFQGEVIALHPFYELNGRITRLYFDLLAIHHGYAPIDYSLAWQDDAEVGNNYIRASIHCVQRADHRLLTQLILTGLAPLQGDEA